MTEKVYPLPKCWRKYPDAKYGDDKALVPSERFVALTEAEQQHIRFMQASFEYYMKCFWYPTVCEAHDYPVHGLPDHVSEWCEILQYELPRHYSRAVLIQAFNGSLKTVTIQGFCAWGIGNDPNLVILVVMNNLEHARRWTTGVRDQLAHPHYKWVFGDLLSGVDGRGKGNRSDDSAFRLTVNRDKAIQDATLTVVSAGTDYTGVRAHWLIGDDFQTIANCGTPNQANALYSKLEVAARRKNPHPDPWKSMTIYICTPVSYADPSMRIRSELLDRPRKPPLGVAAEAWENQRWMAFKYPAILPGENGDILPDLKDKTLGFFDSNGKPRIDNLASMPRVTWPGYGQTKPDHVGAFFTLLSEVGDASGDRLSSGWLDFWRNRQCEPINPDAQPMALPIVHEKCIANGKKRIHSGDEVPALIAWRRTIPREGDRIFEMYNDAGFDTRSMLRIISCDLAMAEKKPTNDPDYTVLQLWLFGRDNISILADMVRFQGMDPITFRSMFREWYQSYDPSKIIVEGNGLQAYVGMDIQEHLGIPPYKVECPQNRRTADDIRNSLAYEVAAGLILIPYADQYSRQLFDPFISELAAYPAGAHDDTVSACALSRIARPMNGAYISACILGAHSQRMLTDIIDDSNDNAGISMAVVGRGSNNNEMRRDINELLMQMIHKPREHESKDMRGSAA